MSLSNWYGRNSDKGIKNRKSWPDCRRRATGMISFFYLNNLPEEQRRRRYLWINHLLCLLLTVLTVGKLYVMAMLQLAAMAQANSRCCS